MGRGSSAFVVQSGDGTSLRGPAGGPSTIKAATSEWLVFPAHTGAFVFVPRMRPHCVQSLEPWPGRILVMFTQSRNATGRRSKARRSPSSGRPDRARVTSHESPAFVGRTVSPRGDEVASFPMGERACFLDATCLSCGMFLEGADADAAECPRCGSARELASIDVRGANFILYCDHWRDTVDFYRRVLGLTETFSNGWFVEFRLGAGAAVSIADAGRTSIRPVAGQGMTLSIEVSDLEAARRKLDRRGAQPSPTSIRFGSLVFDVYDPEGHRIEFWVGQQG